MTAQLLAGELATLVQETKRRAPEIRTAAEKSLQDLKSFANTSESQLAADLRRRPEFIRPFLLACNAGVPKYASPAVVSLQRLVAANGLAQERLEELLEALRECSSLGTDVQLRVLQIMPSLFQRYGDQISETRLATALHICFVLQATKNPVISHTAAATLQQIVNDVFSRVGTERALAEATSPEASRTSWQAELDCHQVLQDLCMIADGKPVERMKKANVSKDFALELIGTVLLGHTKVVPRYTNFVDILRQQLLPLMLRVVSSGAPFSQTVRVLRLVAPVVDGLLEILPTELEMLLSILTHMIEPDAAPSWKRTMCMEAIRDVYQSPTNVRRMYAIFDQQQDRKSVVQQQLTTLGRIAAEKPDVIGLGQASSLPTVAEQNNEDLDSLAALQADPLTATTGVSLSSKKALEFGISTAHSSMKVALIDQLDKTEPPSLPNSYIYSLVLTSLNLLSDGIAKFILPFASSKVRPLGKPQRPQQSGNESSETSSEDDESDHIPTNPLLLEGHADQAQIRAVSKLLEDCWPVLLSAYSTFFQAALDVEYYHTTIRSFQKLIQVATLLRSVTARDAFLTALAKQSLPASVVKAGQPATTSEGRRMSVQTPHSARLSPRNLLCLRALLNLGIALGAVLDDAWSIILKPLQQADVIIGYISADRTLSKGGPASIAPASSTSGELSKEFSGEVAAVRSAASRMLASTSELSHKQFARFLEIVNDLLHSHMVNIRQATLVTTDPGSHRRSTSNASNRAESSPDIRGIVFVIDVYSQLIDCSSARLAAETPEISGWNAIVKALMQIVTPRHLDQEARFAAAETICKSVTAGTFASAAQENTASLIQFGLSSLREVVNVVNTHNPASIEGFTKTSDAAMHYTVLQTLKICLDQHGDSIELGWNDVCTLVLSAFEITQHDQKPGSTSFSPARPLSQKLLRSTFGSLQTICAEDLNSLSRECLPEVLRAVYCCSNQTLDVNVSLTSTSLYQSLSDSIWADQECLELSSPSSAPASDRAVLWLSVLHAITSGSGSHQAEMRASAVHACFRILNSVGDKLSPDDWVVCMHGVILKLYEINESERPEDVQEEGAAPLLFAFDETAAVIHMGASDLLEEYLVVLLKSEQSGDVWKKWVNTINTFLARRSLNLTTTLFTGLKKVLNVLDDSSPKFSHCANDSWRVVLGQKISEHARLDRPASSDNQTALLAFVSCATELYRVSLSETRVEIAASFADQIGESIAISTPTNYANDLVVPTSLQTECIKSLKYVYSVTQHSITSPFLKVLAELLSLSHRTSRPEKTVQGPTHVALIYDVSEFIELIVRDQGILLELQESSGMLECLVSLIVIIQHKRSWKKEDKIIEVWQQATKTALNVFDVLLKRALDRQQHQDTHSIWSRAIETLDAIVAVGLDDEESTKGISANLTFDIAAFERLYSMLVPSLGSDLGSDSQAIRSSFSEVLYLRSIIHEPHPDDSLQPFEASVWPMSKRIGRVRDLEPNLRSKLCYLLVDHLYELVGMADKSTEYEILANSCSPYLQLRMELILKAYITDQPLRGRMPCPLSQKKEIIYMLRKTVALGEATQASAKACGLAQRHRLSLRGLAIMALRVTGQDDGIKEALLQLMEART